MKRKAKRYQVGGLNPYQGDDVDYFSGARDASGSTNARPTYASTEGQVDERDRREMAMADMAKNRPARTAAKAPIVTKEQMKKAGFDNLRDYLNAQKGLTRRGSPTPKAAESKSTERSDRDKLRDTEKAMKGASEEETYRQKMKRLTKEQALESISPESNLIGGGALRGVNALAKALARRSSKGDNLRNYVQPALTYESRKRIGREPLKLESEPAKLGMKKGGMVASKRADGIAQRGKTRGRII
jgi:hypothetical protein